MNREYTCDDEGCTCRTTISGPESSSDEHMAAQQLLRDVLEAASRNVESWPEWRRSEETRAQLAALRQRSQQSAQARAGVEQDDTAIFRGQFLAFWNSLTDEQRRGYFNKTAKRLAHEEVKGAISSLVQPLAQDEVRAAVVGMLTARHEQLRSAVETAVATQVRSLVHARIQELLDGQMKALVQVATANALADVMKRVKGVTEGAPE